MFSPVSKSADDVRVTMNAPTSNEKTRLQSRVTNEYVLVQCDGYRCLGYRDKDGTWRSAFSNEELPEVKQVLS